MFETRDDENDGEGLVDGAFVGIFDDILKKLKVNDSLELAIWLKKFGKTFVSRSVYKIVFVVNNTLSEYKSSSVKALELLINNDAVQLPASSWGLRLFSL